jgi:hypothetical protein
MLEILLSFLKKDLSDRLNGILIARSAEDQTDGEGSNGL